MKVISGSQESKSIFSVLYIMTNSKYSLRPYQGCSNSNTEAVMHMSSFANGFIHDAQDGIKPRSLWPERAWSRNSVGDGHWLTIAMAPLCCKWSGAQLGARGCGVQAPAGGSAAVGGKKELQLPSHPSRGRRSMFGQWLWRKKICRFKLDEP